MDLIILEKKRSGMIAPSDLLEDLQGTIKSAQQTF